MGQASLPGAAVAAILCREMGWTWQQYREQPTWFISMIVSMLREQGIEAKKRSEMK